jgi:hypothetical protein
MTGTAPSLQLPELGPLLGRVAAPEGAELRDRSLEPVRQEMLSALFDHAGRARELLAAGDEPGARAALGRDSWLAIWEIAVRSATEAVMTAAERRLRDAAAVSRIGPKRLAAKLPGSEDRRMLAARLSSAGIGLERSSRDETGSADEWTEGLRRAAGELSAAWDRLTTLAHEEIGAWGRRAAEVQAWRRPWRPLLLTGAGFLLVVGWLGLVLGGYLPVPSFLRPLTDWYWSLPWP